MQQVTDEVATKLPCGLENQRSHKNSRNSSIWSSRWGARAGEVGIIMAQPPLEGWLGGQPSTRQKTPRILGPTRILTPKAVPLLLSKGIIPTDKAQAKMKVSTRLRWEESLSFCRK